jgi:DNA-binding NarL/FixJ family response regulator
VRLFFIDDHEVVRSGLRMLVERVEDFAVVGEAPDGPSAIESIAANPPDVVVTDLVLGQSEYDGLQTIREIRRVAPACRVLVLSMRKQPLHVRSALEAGAIGYTAKDDEWRELVTAIRTVAAGERYLSRAVIDWEGRAEAPAGDTPRHREIVRLADEGYGSGQIAELLGLPEQTVEAHRRLAMLTPRQREILRLIAEGNRSKEIAETLHLAAKTVDTHRTQLIQRLNLHNVAELTRFAIEVGLIDVHSPRAGE